MEENRSKEVLEVSEVFKIKKRPADNHYKQSVNVFDDGACPRKSLADINLFKHKEKEVVKPPKYVVVACTVPKARKHPNDKHIKRPMLSVAAERNVDVIPEK